MRLTDLSRSRSNLLPMRFQARVATEHASTSRLPAVDRPRGHPRATRLWSSLRVLVLPGLGVLLALYVALHSPVRDLIAALFHMDSRGCYFCLSLYPTEQIASAAAALTLLALSLAAAWTVVEQLDIASYERGVSFGLVALAIVTVPSAVIGVIGYWLGLALLRPPTGPLLAAAPAALVLALALRRHSLPAFHVDLSVLRDKLEIFLTATATLLVIASAYASLTHPPTGTDALGYHAPLADFLWRGGDLGSFLKQSPSNWILAHPGTAELWFGLLGLIGGERLASLGQLPFAALGAASVGVFARRLGFRRGAARLAGLSFLFVPMVVAQLGMQLDDLVGAALLMATISLASTPTRDWTSARAALVGCGLGLTAATKLALLPTVAAVALFVLVVLRWEVRPNRRSIACTGILIGVFLAIVAPWWLRNLASFGNPVYPQALPLIGRGFTINQHGLADLAFVPSPIAWPVYPLIEPLDEQSGLGALFVVAAIPGLLVALLRRRRRPLLLYFLALGVSLPFWWLLTPHFPRFLLGLVGLGFGFVPYTLLALPRGQRRLGAALLALTALFSALVTFDQAILPLSHQPTSRAQFYDSVWAVDPFVSSLPESDSLILNTGYAPPTVPEYAAFYPLLGPSQSRLVIPIDGQPSTEAIITTMRQRRISYVYVLASPENSQSIKAKYDSKHFVLVHESAIVPGEKSGARRNLFRLATPAELPQATLRLLYKLKS